MVESARFRHGPVVPQVENLLRERLRSGHWRPGDRLPNEVQLAGEIGVGRSSIREAVRLLARDGLLDVRHGSGTFVAEPPSEPEGAEGMRQVLRRARIVEVYEVRRALEVEAARLAAERAQPEDIDHLRLELHERQEHHGRQTDLKASREAFVDADLDFHRAVVELSGNALLLKLFSAAMPILREALIEMVSVETDLPDTSHAHEALLDALARNDTEAAVAATADNLEATLAALRAT